MTAFLAHSAGKNPPVPPQTYLAHVSNVLHRVENNIDCLSSYYRGDLEYFREVVRAAAIYHDLGKLDSDNQEVFLHGGIKRLPVNHIDAGNAFLLKNTMGRSSILVFSHHAYPPHYGLPSIPAEIAKDEFCLRDDKTMSQTEQKLEEYISKHVESGFQQWKQVKDSPTEWNGLTLRVLFLV